MKWLCRICLRLWSHKEKQKREEALPEIYKHIMICVQSIISLALYMIRLCVWLREYYACLFWQRKNTYCYYLLKKRPEMIYTNGFIVKGILPVEEKDCIKQHKIILGLVLISHGHYDI
jgi:hypothetical protein